MGRRDTLGQAARKLSGERAEGLVEGILRRDRKVKGFEIRLTGNLEEGLDIELHPPDSCAKREEPCREPILLEAKSVEKLFERDAAVPWPKNRASRFVLKRREEPDCYAFITRDEITKHTAVDFVENGPELAAWKKKQKGKSQKLPVRAIPLLRKRPCPHIDKCTVIVEEG